MYHIGKHIGGNTGKPVREKSTERGELMQYFMQKLNPARVRDGLPPLTMGRMGRIFVAIPTPDLYFLKSVCDDAQKRYGLDAFCKKFWWEVKPEHHTPEAKAASAKRLEEFKKKRRQ
ncbi:MAG: hypothetical protein JWL87_296 [Candidatus Adlerbacteria bacterium]|nr:hypothetical protein [Candidatus Adlerbacteria bacterium]